MASPLRRKVIEAFQRYRTPLNMAIELPTIEAIKRFVAMGNGVALVPHLTVARELETGDLVRVPVTSWTYAACCAWCTAARPRSPTPPRRFCRRCRTMAKEQGPPFYYHVERAGWTARR